MKDSKHVTYSETSDSGDTQTSSDEAETKEKDKSKEKIEHHRVTNCCFDCLSVGVVCCDRLLEGWLRVLVCCCIPPVNQPDNTCACEPGKW
ncbi:hypothetical protein JYU34_017857 [Plutella xylostella]|uniref:Uncharacterized protein n=1 Tax=Plutella xylostella TaxID=51655 RepID=A0ABQ7PZ61_PLUXY|nr:hypothetical protein JYU34_017857 [Plutella xylostella]